ncbi:MULTISPECIES: valine--tRNA ligase [unclassified Rhodococcus (in: high G+C Gram-positive bacteria)]|uniref:valine--tRNA ligase n=1 Tax=unclassified Rhodococcus (in: high G+C Gram-positive bacteria) TaxID=192944 RepID=UPI0007BC66B1|nr:MULTISPECIES: valine--tRNA ligase [unclassified Rhodococcus (in: high G+C Gram-positive bacteria)]KZF00997.1 valine--tRNA ligase [Rhodococcus sp. EPR-147]KZF02413.1 valine--tRNA ligase [Rhodococcus sp. EPR-279]OZE35533.1 valine--tRNA ligase [Rhodococcus sp. 05-2254-4]OZE47962.1 valine--tRNA ligase [Rhodococcus sp. 05-2254-3]OZE49173.1 valine--tRNA ligase [Rhodococcus sp. 05-2254-2]
MTSSAPEHSENPADSIDLPKSWDPSAVEAELYRSWVDAGYFEADATSGKPPYSIVLPPPNVTGSLHMGHALDHTLMDALSRRKRMLGYEVLWLPGMDHAGIATQTVVEKQLAADGKTKEEFGREAFIDKVWDWKRESGGTIGGQMRRIGDGVDWSRERFTMDDGLSEAVQTMFKRMFDDGLIYRAERLVNWSPVLQTAISDIEVKFEDVDGELVSLRYGSLDDSEPHVIVATTRVETMLGDTAVAVHPDDERYKALVGTTLEHPFTGRQIPIIADDYVDPEFGTGAVKITPAHDPNDFEMGVRHSLPMPSIMDKAGRIADTGTQFDGMDRFEARVKVREALAEQGRVVAEKRPYLHSVGHSERSGEPIEPRLSLQWWVKVDTLAKAAGDAVRNGDTVIHPKSQEPRWFAWVDNMHDWCISRQLWWGHRIPIWYGPDGETVCLGPGETPPEGWEQDPDVLDTWFSSGLWPFSTMGWPDATADLEKFYPTGVLVTGYDILFFWVARMMMFGTYVGADDAITAGKQGSQVPFRDVFLHGLIRDQFGKKMSKSRGNGIDPLDWVDRFGADALRFTLARGANPGADMSVGEDHAQSSRNFANKLFNATKFALMNGAAPADLPSRSELTDADRWILDRLEQVRAEVDSAFDRYEFSKACEALYHFAWDEVCDWYLEIAKVQFADDAIAVTTRGVLGNVLDALLRLLHPVIPFVTETLWKVLTGGESLVIAAWPTASTDSLDSVAAQRIEDMQRLITEIRRFRSDQGLKPSQKVAARIVGVSESDLDGQISAVTALARLTEPAEDFAATASVEVRLSKATVVVELDTSGTVDLVAERARLVKDLAAAEKELAQTTGKLGNEAFLAKAPDAVVDKIRTRQTIAGEEIARITARLESMGT